MQKKNIPEGRESQADGVSKQCDTELGGGESREKRRGAISFVLEKRSARKNVGNERVREEVMASKMFFNCVK